jgi:ribosomal protein S7
MVDALAIQKKLSEQLKIDLEKHETVHILDEALDTEDTTEDEVQALVDALDTSKRCEVQIRRLGTFLARINLSGGYAVPLKFEVVRS